VSVSRAASPFRDHYAVLGVEPDATETEIKAAFWELAKRYHPDVSGEAAPATRRFAEISEARSVLLSPSQRAAFDRERAARMDGDPETTETGPVAVETPPAEPEWRGVALLIAGLVMVLVTLRLLPLATRESLPSPEPVGAFDGGVLTGTVCCAASAAVAALALPAWRGRLTGWRWEVLVVLLALWLCAGLVGELDPHLLLGGLFSVDLEAAAGGHVLVLGIALMLGGAILVRPRPSHR
jgi:DnaJ domain